MSDYGLLACAAFFAGVLNTIAGGGTFLTLPALVFTGVPLVTANATSAVAVSPGYLGGAAGFRREISAYPRRQLLKIVGATLFGGLVGSLLLLVSSNEAFSFVVPFLLLIATTAFAFAEPAQKWAQRHRFAKADNMASLIVVAIYGGYFNSGLGIVLLALFACWGMRDLDQMNGLKNAILRHICRDLCSRRPGSLAAGTGDDGSRDDWRLCRRAARTQAADRPSPRRHHQRRHGHELDLFRKASELAAIPTFLHKAGERKTSLALSWLFSRTAHTANSKLSGRARRQAAL